MAGLIGGQLISAGLQITVVFSLSYPSTNGIFVFNIKIMAVIGFYTNFHCNNAKNMINLIARKLCKFIRLAVLWALKLFVRQV